MIATYAIAFTAALGVSLIVTPIARRLAMRLDVIDLPADRKVHTDPTPYLGGLAIVGGFCFATAGGAIVLGLTAAPVKMAVLLGGGLVLSVMGLWDDLRVVPGWIKVPLELLMGAVLFYSGSRVELFGNHFIDFVLTVAWVIGITNAVNYMDNMDGLTSGVVGIASLYFFVLGALSGQVLVAGLSVALAGCALGFLWYNKPPAKIFMGDTGSLFLGFLLAGLGLDLKFQNVARITFFVPVAILALPILDALLVSVSRVRKGLSPIHPGQDHVSHRLVALGIPSSATVGLLYFAAVACGWIGVVIAYSKPLTAYMLMGWLVALGLFLGVLLLRVNVYDRFSGGRL